MGGLIAAGRWIERYNAGLLLEISCIKSGTWNWGAVLKLAEDVAMTQARQCAQ